MSSIESTSANQPSKKGLNPIIKAMNDYRNNVIGEKIGSKAPKKTAPVFKVTLEAARLDLGIEEGVKNTIAIVDKASELFTANPDKFLELAQKLESELKDKDTGKTKKTKKTKEETTDSKSKTKKADNKDTEDVETNDKTKNVKSKSSKKLSKKDTEEDNVVVKETKTKKSSKKLTKEEDNNSEEEVKQVKKKSPKKPVQKKASPKKQVIESDTESESESD